MKSLKKLLSVVIVLSILNLYFPNITFAEQHQLFAKARITKHKPEILTAPERDIPVEVVKEKSYTWLWVALGVLAIGGAAAAGGGGGGEPPSPQPPPQGGDTGDVTVTW